MNEAGNKQKNEKNVNKQFRWNGVILSIQSRSLFPYLEHLINKELKLSAAFL